MQVCFFDIDGTLINTGGAGMVAFEEALISEFDGAKLPKSVSTTGRTDRGIARDLFKLHDIEDSQTNWERLQECYVRRLRASLPRHEGRVLPGITSLLERLAGRADVIVGLLTGNVREGARLKLEHYGLFHHFALGGYGDRHVDRGNVAQEAFDAVCQHLSTTVNPRQVWVIGDTPLDVRCARSIGAKALAVATGTHTVDELASERPDCVLDDLSNTDEAATLLA